MDLDYFERLYLADIRRDASPYSPPARELGSVSAMSRKEAVKSGAAMPDGSFPIRNAQELSAAIKLWGHAKDPAKAKAHIISRAKALGLTKMLPDTW